jgi:hypothetical protein
MYLCLFQVTKGRNALSFYSLPEFEEWKQETPDWNRWSTKYYKGILITTINSPTLIVREEILFFY